MSLDVLLDIVS